VLLIVSYYIEEFCKPINIFDSIKENIMNVKEFKEWLNDFPEDAEVYIPVITREEDWGTNVIEFASFDKDDYRSAELVDFSNTEINFSEKVKKEFGEKKVLFLGEES